MKRLEIVLMCCVLMLVFAACGKKNEEASEEISISTTIDEPVSI